MKVRLSVVGADEAVESLGFYRNVLGDFREEMTLIGNYMLPFYRDDVFETEGQAFGSRWKSLNPLYEFFKRKEFPGRGILEASGALRSSYRMNVTDSYTEISVGGSSAPYAVYHQEGEGVPKRELLRSNKQIEGKVNDLFAENVQKRMNKR